MSFAIAKKCLSFEVARNTKYKSVANAFNKHVSFSVIQQGGKFCVRRYGCSDRTYNLVIKETKRLYPYLRYSHDKAF